MNTHRVRIAGVLLLVLAASLSFQGCGQSGAAPKEPGAAQPASDTSSRIQSTGEPGAAAQSVGPEPSLPGIAEKPAASPEAKSPVPAVAPGATPPQPDRKYPRPEEVPIVSMGREPQPSPLTQSPGYYPPNDPEADAVRTGRREAKKIDVPFTGGETSPEELAQKILDALQADDFAALQSLRITPSEFKVILWPEFPESRPITNSKPDDVYFFLDRKCHSGITLGLSTYSGQSLKLLGITYAVGRVPYTNFTLYEGVEIHVQKPDGQEDVLKFAPAFAERDGVWKVYAYKDKN